MPISIPEVVASILTFAGGVLLVVDTFSPVRAFYVKRGDEKWKLLVSKFPSENVIDEKPLEDREALFHAKRSQWLVRIGFLLITAGFAVDVLSKLHVL